MDVRPGGVWRFDMRSPNGVDYKNKSFYLEVLRPMRLFYTHFTGPIFQMTVNFTEQGGKTELTTRMLFESAMLPDRVAREFGAIEGLSQTIDRLEEHLANVD